MQKTYYKFDLKGDKSNMKLGILYQNGAVFQRNAPIRISGEGCGRLEVRFLKKSYCFEIAEERWERCLDAELAGGPYKMEFSLDGLPFCIDDVYIGDVYLCAGQSNMEIVLEKCYCDRQALRDDSLIRCFELQTTTKEYSWKHATKENALKMTAIGYYFAKYAKEEGVCVGIVSCNRGATCAETWIDRELLLKAGLFVSDEEKQRLGQLFYPYNRCGELHKMLFSELRCFSFAACIYYQGENNAAYPDDPPYDKLMELLIDSWREELGGYKLPFVICELCDFGEYTNGKINFAQIREHQRRVVQKRSDDAVYYITTTDLGEIYDIHPRRKKEIAERFWRALSCNVFKKSCEWCGPFAEYAVIEGDSAIIHFSHADNMRAEGKVRTLTVSDNNDAPLEILSAEVVGSTIEIKASGKIAHISLFFRNNPMTNIFNGAGLPATGFKI